MVDARQPLPDGFVLGKKKKRGRAYEIRLKNGRPFAAGGSSLVYKAVRDDGFLVLVKEVYHMATDNCLARNQFGELLPPAKNKRGFSFAEFDQNRDLMRNKAEEAEKKYMANITGYVEYIESFEENNTFYSVISYKESYRNLKEYAAENPCNLYSCLYAARRIADNLKVLHGLGRLHLDIKPDNIIVTDENKSDPFPGIFLIDFNSMVRVNDRGELVDTEHGDVVSCSLDYAAPEVIRGDLDKVSFWSDTYSATKVLMWLLSGSPAGGSASGSISDSATGGQTVYSGVSELFLDEIDGFLHRGLHHSTEPAESLRFKSVDDMLAAINHLIARQRETMIGWLKTAKANMSKIILIQKLQKAPPEFSDEPQYSKNAHIERKKRLFPNRRMPKELYETLPWRWRVLSQLKGTAPVFFILFALSLYLAFEDEIVLSFPIALMLLGLLAHNAICAHLFAEWKTSASYVDCLGYILAKWSYLGILISIDQFFCIIVYGGPIDYVFSFMYLVTSTEFLAIAAVFGILHIASQSAWRFAQGISNKILVDSDYQKEAESLIDSSALKHLPAEYRDMFMIQALIDIAEQNTEPLSIQELISATAAIE